MTSQRARGSAAVVIGRADPAPAVTRDPEPADAAGWPRWFIVLAAGALGAAVAWLWALLVLGDALSG